MSIITRDQVDMLSRLYREREELQKDRERSDINFWASIVNEFCGGTGTRSSVVNALGGKGELAAIMFQAASKKFEKRQQEIDQEIIDHGGHP